MSNQIRIPKIKQSYPIGSEGVILKFLQEHPVGTLALVDEENQPHATVIYLSISENFTITFTTKEDTKKSRILRQHDRIMLTVFDIGTQTTCQIAGRAVVVDDFIGAKDAFDSTVSTAASTSEGGIPPIAKLYAGKYVAYQIIPDQISITVFAVPETNVNAHCVVEFVN